MNGIFKRLFIIFFVLIGMALSQSTVFSEELFINILVVNGTNDSKEKEIKQFLPSDLTAEDILDTAGLKLDYDINKKAYYVYGNVSLASKESKTLKVRIKDIWKFDTEKIDEIKKQVDASVERLKETEFSGLSEKKKESLLQRIDYVQDEEKKNLDNIELRVDRFMVYANELESIRKDAVSISYWRAKPPEAVDGKVIKFVIEVENTLTDKSKSTVEVRHYLPSEVKPDHLIEAQGFQIRYDPERGQSYLKKDEELKPLEKKKYEISVIDIWSFPQINIDNLKDRSREAYKLLEKSEYQQSAKYLVDNIKDNLEKVENSQIQERDIKAHIGEFRVNEKRFKSARNDVESLEDLLNALRENLERSKVKNVLQKIKSVKSLADVAESIIGTKPSANNSWKIIAGIVVFVGLITFVNFLIWGKRSKEMKLTELKKQEESKTTK